MKPPLTLGLYLALGPLDLGSLGAFWAPDVPCCATWWHIITLSTA